MNVYEFELKKHREMASAYLTLFRDGIVYRHDLPLHRQPKVLVNYHLKVAEEMESKNGLLSDEEKNIIFSELLYDIVADYVYTYVRKPGGWNI